MISRGRGQHRVTLRRALLLLTGVSPAGCAESTVVRTVPSGTDVWVEGQFIGKSPATFVVSRSEWREVFQCHLEKEGYLQQDCEMHDTIGAGRIVGGVFSLGISLIFKRPSTLQSDCEFTLVRDPAYEPTRSAPPNPLTP
jgi:hypothetical protein